MKTPISKRTITVATKQELTDPHYFLRLWLAIRNASITRRRWLDELSYTIYNFDGVILLPDGRKWAVPDLDDIIGDPRWISLLLEQVEGKPKRMNIRKIDALRIFDLYFRIKHPHIARHFGR